MIEANRMRMGEFEFEIDFASFRRITQCWSGPGWDFNFAGACVNVAPNNETFPDGRIGLYCEAAPLPMEKAADYSGIDMFLPGTYDEDSGEPYFKVWVCDEGYDVSDVTLRFTERAGSRYRIELLGKVPSSVLGQEERFELSAWADEEPDHAYST